MRSSAAIACGLPINPDIIRAQVEGDVDFGLRLIRSSAVTIKAVLWSN
jgi:hypothetical protein